MGSITEDKSGIEHLEDDPASHNNYVKSNQEDEQIDPRVKALEKSVGPILAALIPLDAPWYKTRHLLKLNVYLTLTCLASSSLGYDNSLINSLQAFPEWLVDLMESPDSEWLGFIVVTLAIGGIVGNIIAPYISDRFGRLVVVRIGVFGVIAFSLGQTFVKTSTEYIIIRTFIGVFVAFLSQTVVLIAELSFPTYRSFFSCFYMTMYYAGSFLGAWVAYGARNLGNWSWKSVTIVQIAFPIALLPAILFLLPESPRWLVSGGRIEEARDVLIKLHTGGDPRFTALVDLELTEIIDQVNDDERSKSITWASMFKGRANQWRSFISITLGIFAQWNGVGVISYYLPQVLTSVGITDVTSQTLINGFMQFWNFLCAGYAAFNVDKFGRRFLFLWSTIGMLVSYIIITGLSAAYAEQGNKHAGSAVIAFLFIYYGHYDVAFTPLVTCYPVEIWPYHYRTKGIALENVSTYLALLFNQFVNPVALENIHWKYYFVFVGVLVVMLITIYLWYPETKGHNLEEVEKVFEKHDDYDHKMDLESANNV